jgi:hypothetical protein
VKVQTLLAVLFTLAICLQLTARLLPISKLRLLFFKSNVPVFRVKETTIDYQQLVNSQAHGKYTLVQNYNDSIVHNFNIHISELDSVITISSSIFTTNPEVNNTSTRNMQISTVKIKLANLTNSDISLTTLFVSNFINLTSNEAIDAV